MATETYEGVGPQEVVASLDRRLSELEHRIESIERGQLISDEALMLTIMDARIRRIEQTAVRLLALAEGG